MAVGQVYTLDTAAAEAALDRLAAKEQQFKAVARQGQAEISQRFVEAARQALEYQHRLGEVRNEYLASKAIVNELTRALATQREVTRALAAEQKKASGADEQKRLTQELQKSQAEERKLRTLIQESQIAVEQEADAVRKRTEARKQELAQQRLANALQREAAAAEKERARASKEATPSQLPPAAADPAGGGFLSGILGKVGPAAAAFFSLNAIISKVREGVDKAAASSGLQATFTALTGSAKKGAQEIAFLKQEADALGLDMPRVAEAYKGLFAAAKGANLPLDQTREIFEAINIEGRVVGTINEKLEGALRAVQQMLSKGTVSAEELRGQLGEALPNATELAAQALGVTTVELDKMLRKGQVVAKDFLPKFAAEIRKTYGGAVADAAQSLPADLNRINNAISTSAAKIAGVLAPAIAAFADLIAAPAKLSEATAQEIGSLEELSQQIRETSVGSAERVRLVKELQEQYPAYLGNLNAETVSNQDLSKAIDSVTESLVNRLIVQEQDEKIAEQAKNTAKRRKEAIEEERKLRLALIEVEKQNEAARRRDAKQNSGEFKGDLVPSLKNELEGLPLNTQAEQVIALTNKGNSGLARTNSAYLQLVKTFQDYTFVQTLLAGQQQKANELTNERREILKALGIEEKKQITSTSEAQAKATQGFIDKLEAQKAALQKQKKELPGSFMDAGYRASINDFNTQIAEIDRQLDILNNKKDKAGDSRENKLKAALEAVLREQQTYRELAEKAAVDAATDARAASERQLTADLNALEDAKKKLVDAELKAKGLGGKGLLADGKLDATQLDQANLQEEAVYKAHYDRLVDIARKQEDFLLSLKKDSNQKQLDELDLRFDREKEKYRDQPAELAALEAAYQRERRALLNKQANDNLNKGEAQAVTLVEQAALEFEDPIKAERFKQQALLDVQIEFAKKRLALAKAVNNLDGNAETRKAVTDLENLIGNLSNNLKQLQKGSPFDLYKFVLGEEGDTDENRRKVDEIAALAISTVNTILQAEQQAAQAKIDAKTREIDELQRNLDRELQYNKAGSASNIANTRAEIAAAKVARREALEDQRKAAKQQQLIQDLTAVSSIASAAANLILGWSTIPFVGQVLGALSVGAMLASFVAVKSKAKSAAQSEGFFKGGFTGHGDPHEESQVLGKKNYLYHKGEYVMPHDVTARYRYELLEPLHLGRLQDIDWSAPKMQELLPDYSLPKQLRSEQKAIVEHRLQVQFAPMQAELQGMQAKLAAIEKQVTVTANRPDMVPMQGGYLERDPVSKSTSYTKLEGLE
jgi:tape measure domain-containing protein